MTKEKCRLCDVEFRIKTPERRQRAILTHLSTHHPEIDQLSFLLKFENFQIPKCRFCNNDRKKIVKEKAPRLSFLTTCGEQKCIMESRKMSESSKNKIRIAMVRAHKEGRANNWYNSKKAVNNKSWLENVLEKFLIEEGISYYFQFPILRYHLDFAILEYKIDLEIDGKKHLSEKAILHDNQRDLEMEKLGWTVYRISGHEFYRDPKGEFNKFLQFLNSEERASKKYNVEETMSSIGGRQREYRLKVENNKKIKKESIEKIKVCLLDSDIDFSKLGWAMKASKLIEISPQKVSKWMKRNMTEFYEKKCFKKGH